MEPDPLALIREQAARVVALEAENAALLKTVAMLTERVATLERLLGSGGRGGGRGTPPPTRPPSGRPRGGQRGHKGISRARPAVIDETREHPVGECPHCGTAVESSVRVTDRFEFEAMARVLRTIRHVLHQGWCPQCRRRVRASAGLALPDSNYGPRAHATLAALRATMGASIGDLETFTRTIWQRPVAGGQIVVMLDRVAAALVPTFWWLVDQLTHAPVLHEDSTSWVVDGQRAVLWAFTSRWVTAFWIDPSGSGQVPRAVLGEAIDGAVVSDSAERMQLVAHAGSQRCLAHPLRDARDLLVAHPDRDEIVAMMTPLKAHLSWMIGLHARRETLSASTWLQYRARARRDLLALALRSWTDEDCVRMAKRIRRDVDLWVMFLWDPTGEVEPTNNRAERALRPGVIDRRRVQQNRSLGGVYRDVVLRSVGATCKQLGVSFEAVMIEALLARGRDGPDAVPPTLRGAIDAAKATGVGMRAAATQSTARS